MPTAQRGQRRSSAGRAFAIGRLSRAHPNDEPSACDRGFATAIRHLLFRDWLRTHPEDRELYATTKVRLAEATAADPDSYNLAKNEVIDSIYARIFDAEPPSWIADEVLRAE